MHIDLDRFHNEILKRNRIHRASGLPTHDESRRDLGQVPVPPMEEAVHVRIGF